MRKSPKATLVDSDHSSVQRGEHKLRDEVDSVEDEV